MAPLQPCGNQVDNVTSENTTLFGNATIVAYENFTNFTLLPNDTVTGSGNTLTDDQLRKLNEFHIIKAVVLTVVTLVILLSICKMMFGMILKYPGKPDK